MASANGGDEAMVDAQRTTAIALKRAAPPGDAGPAPDGPRRPSASAEPRRLSRRVVALMAVASGAAVANLYYIQPLLTVVARGLHVSDGAAGLLVTASQIGYVAGLAFLVPIGDIVERRRMIATILLGTAVAAAACAAAPGFGVLLAAMVALGALSVVAQVIVPLASTLAAPHERGQIVGTVMSGLLIGILMARTLSGLVAALGGWRLVYALAAGAMLVLSVTLQRALPAVVPTERAPYRAVLRSIVTLIAHEPLLRQRMALGALQFAVFSVLWTTIAFLLASSPYHYGTAVIGLFGLAGAAGAAVAPLAGRLNDRRGGNLGMAAFLALVLASWGLLALGRTSLLALIAGIVGLDMGLQGAQITNQTTIYRLAAHARSRLTTAYMVAVFLGGVVGSTLSVLIYTSYGWTATCALGAGLAAGAGAVLAATRRVSSSVDRAAPPAPR
jgi:predicted MFS family arabinose efflux permease